MSLKTIRTALDKLDNPAMINFLQELIAISSENPPGEEIEIVEKMSAMLHSLGCEVDLQKVEPRRYNIIASLPGEEPEELLFYGHSDTVPVGVLEKWRFDPFGGSVDDGYLYGRGAADMKSGLAAMIFAIKAIVDSGIPRQKSLLFASVVDKKQYLKGIKALFRKDKLKNCKMGIVGEATSGHLVTMHKGALEYTARISGVYSTVGEATKDNNAILKMSQLLKSIRKYNIKMSETKEKIAGMGYPLVNPSMISGGTSIVMVPDDCYLKFSRTVFPYETIEQAKDEIRQMIQKTETKYGFKIELSEDQQLNPWKMNLDEQVVKDFRKAFKIAINEEPDYAGLNNYSEAEMLQSRGIPSIVYGPGDTSTKHRANERVAIEDLVCSARIYIAFATQWLSGTKF